MKEREFEKKAKVRTKFHYVLCLEQTGCVTTISKEYTKKHDLTNEIKVKSY